MRKWVAWGLLAVSVPASAAGNRLTYRIEWRLVDAGRARFEWTHPRPQQAEGRLHLETHGVVGRLFKVDNDYRVSVNQDLCATSAGMQLREGNRRRETEVVYRAAEGKASFLERDLLKDAVVSRQEVKTPPCVHDVLAGLAAIRERRIPIGQSELIPVSDGKKFANVRVEAQANEEVKTPLGTFKAVRHEVHLMNGVIYGRSGRVYVWLTDDARRLPVQIRVRLQILVGTITLQLAQEETI
jgi:hypothetical protein